MLNTTDTTIDPRVWIGCLACYNNGHPIGQWFTALEAENVTTKDVHATSARARPDCEELWVMDSDGLPISREISPAEASAWGRLLQEVDEWQLPALLAWVRSGDYIAEGSSDLPSLPDFEERFAGEWSSFRDYAEALADDIGLIHDVPEAVAAYCNWDAWSADLAYDYATAPAPGGGVFVFRAL